MANIGIYNKIKDRTFLSSEAARFAGVAQRTLQAWTEKGLIDCETTGTGDRRKYTAKNCVEIGIIKKLADLKMPFKYISQVMEELKQSRYISVLLMTDYCFLIVCENPGDELITDWYPFFPQRDEDASKWVEHTCRQDIEKVCVYNMSLISERILGEIDKVV